MIQQLKTRIKNFITQLIINNRVELDTQVEQIQLINQYRLMKKLMNPEEMPRLLDVGFKVYSQFNEDGILLYIFSILGTTNKKVVEICAGDGRECMATNLIINHGWEGLLFDGSEQAVENGNKFFASHKSTWLQPPIFKHAWITKENVNKLIQDEGYSGNIDLLSLDIDGNDYYIMEAIDVIQPRVIICETHNVIPSDLSITIPYKSDFNKIKTDVHPDFQSVSLLAMKKLLNKKGYRLIGGHSHGFNVVFVQNNIGIDYFPEVSVESIHDNTFTRFRRDTSWNEVKDLPWIKV